MRLFDLCVAKKLSGGETSNSGDITVYLQGSDASFSTAKRVSFGKAVTEISAYGFQGYEIEEIDLPIGGSLRIIGQSAFALLYKLKSVKIPSTVTNIKKKAFYNDTELKTVDMTDFDTDSNMPALGSEAFTPSTGFTILFKSQDVLNNFAADNSWAVYSRYFGVES